MLTYAKISGWLGDENNAFTKEGRTSYQNEYFDFTSKLFNGEKRMKRYILKNDALHS
jgi:hypothetical protein